MIPSRFHLTNVIPQVPAPPGLYYYLHVKHLPPQDQVTRLICEMLGSKYSIGHHVSSAISSVIDVQEWLPEPLTEGQRVRIQDLGYNLIMPMQGVPRLLGIQVNGSRFALPALMTVMDIIAGLHVMFTDTKLHQAISPQYMARTRSTITTILEHLRIEGDLHFSEIWLDTQGSTIDFDVVPVPDYQAHLRFQMHKDNPTVVCINEVAFDALVDAKSMWPETLRYISPGIIIYMNKLVFRIQ